jgi:hypothetical protein
MNNSYSVCAVNQWNADDPRHFEGDENTFVVCVYRRWEHPNQSYLISFTTPDDGSCVEIKADSCLVWKEVAKVIDVIGSESRANDGATEPNAFYFFPTAFYNQEKDDWSRVLTFSL